MSSTTLGGIAEKYSTSTTEALPQSDSGTDSSSPSLMSLKKVHPQFVPRNREDYPSAVDEDDLDTGVEVLPILYNQELPSAEDCFNIFDDETNFDRCHAVLCDPKESVTHYFINDEDLFARLNSDSDYSNQDGEEDIDGPQLLEEDIFFGSGWDSDETVTDARLLLGKHLHAEAEETADVALQGTVPAEDGAKYFDAEDLFEREELEILVYGRDGWISEDWDFKL